MSTGLMAADTQCRATCEHCGTVCERSLGDSGLEPAANREIVCRVARNHERTCPESGEGWGQTVSVDVVIDGGDS